VRPESSTRVDHHHQAWCDGNLPSKTVAPMPSSLARGCCFTITKRRIKIKLKLKITNNIV